MSKYAYYFFDLDGTLTQSEYGIMESFRYALEKMGIDDGGDEKLKTFIGPPLFNSFRDGYRLSDEEADRGVTLYREYYNEYGFKNAPLYEGITCCLEQLKSEGAVLMVVTSKPEALARRVIQVKEIERYFADVVGPTPDNKEPDKSWLIYEAMRRLGIEKDNSDVKKKMVMVGDRFYDIEAAKKVGIDSVGVLYGYGSLEELKSAGATYLAERPENIVQ